jgi:peroxiredoxin Q/BCP
VAGISSDSVEAHRAWIRRLRIPYPLLSDVDRAAARSLGLVRRIGIGDWKIELLRRTTLLVDTSGIVAAVWGKVHVRGHAAEVLRAAIASRRTVPPAEAPRRG